MMLITGLLRYGVFDEFGFSGDQEYPNYFTIADRSFSLFVILSPSLTNPYVVQSPIIPYYKIILDNSESLRSLQTMHIETILKRESNRFTNKIGLDSQTNISVQKNSLDYVGWR